MVRMRAIRRSGSQSFDLPYLCFDLRHIDLFCNQKAVQIHLGNSKVGILTNRFLLKVVPQFLEIFNLGGGQVELFAVTEHKSDQRPLLAFHGAGTEIFPPATEPFAQLARKVIQTLRELLVLTAPFLQWRQPTEVQPRKPMTTGIPRKLVSS